MSRDRSPRRLRRRERYALIAASLTALSLTSSGCVVVHGERVVLPAATRAEAAKAVTAFTAAYNKADKAYDNSLDAPYLTGPFGDITAARLKAGHANSPSGNPAHVPLKLSDIRITIPKKAGWPRWFLADARANKTGKARWLMVFTRGGLGQRWRVAYVTLVAPGAVPEFTTDKDGGRGGTGLPAQLAVAPGKLSADYAAYLKKGGTAFAAGDVHQRRTRQPGQAGPQARPRHAVHRPAADGRMTTRRWRCARRTAARWCSSPPTTTRSRRPPPAPPCRSRTRTCRP